MKRMICKWAAVFLLGAVCLMGCSQKEKLPEEFDAAVVEEEAKKAISLFNERDYQSIIDMGDEHLKGSTGVAQFEESCNPLLDEKGAFQEISELSLVGNEDKASGVKYGGAIVEGTYENGEIVFSIAFNEEMELVQFLIR